jgi:aldehyde:ferredoxin oxidoreductase
MASGYHGRILHVDLTSVVLEVEQPEESFYRKYMGGSVLGLYYLFHNTPSGVDSHGPDNTLILAAGILTGAPISGQSRITATAKEAQEGVGRRQK